MTTVTLSSEYRTFNSVDGYIVPGADSSTWWTLGDTTNGWIDVNPGTTIKIRSVETAVTPHTSVVHKDIAEVGCIVHECRDTDTTYYHFTFTNVGMQGVRLNFGTPIAIIL
jgi:hypothetical protein